MKIKFILTAVLIVAGATVLNAKEYRYTSVPGDLMKTRIYTLDNGLKVYLSVNNEKPRIQTYIAVKTGSRNDPAETTGLAHYLEHIMFKGTKQFGTSNAEKEAVYLKDIEERYERYRLMTDPAQRKKAYQEIDSVSQLAAQYFIPNEYDKLMSAIGAEKTNAYTSNDVTCYTEDIPANEIENWAKIQSDRFQNMVVRGFHTELEAVYEEFNMGLTNDGRKSWTAFSKLLTPSHPYGTQTTIGTQQHLQNPSIVNIKNYFNRYYVPNNVAICMAGDFEPDQVMAIIDKYFGSWKPNPNLTIPYFPKEPAITSVRDTTVIGPEAESVMLGWRFDGAASLQTDTIQVIAEVLSNGKAGLMDLNLEQKMKCLGSNAFSVSLAEYGTLALLGTPKEGQSLEELRNLLLGEIDNLKQGNFSDDLLPSVINNMKLAYYKSLEENEDRADQFVNAFINGQKWEDVVNRLNRISKITKAQIVEFAKQHLNNNYVAVYKKQGVDNNIKKIDKPQITPIPSNRDMQSDFVKSIINSHVAPIQPRFIDFKKDLTQSKTKKGLPVLYVQNKDNGIFTLAFMYKLGIEADNRLPIAANYMEYLGTDKMTAEEVKQQFYKLACNFNIKPSTQYTYVTLSGLSENMAQALELMENVLANAKVDTEAYKLYIDNVGKSRKDAMANQQQNFRALIAYGKQGAYNSVTNIMTNKQLEETNPQVLIDLIKGLKDYQHTVLYAGPTALGELIAVVDKGHKTIKKLKAVPAGKEYKYLTTPQNEVLIAPYDAKNIYMVQYHNENKQWNPENQALINLFNEYFGGGMNGIVFQEMRETRGLAYSASAFYDTPSRQGDPEYAQTFIISQNDKLMDCINGFNSIINNMPQADKAFDLAKQALTKRIATERTTKFAIINAYIEAQNQGIDYDLNEKVYKAIPTLQLQDLVNFEKEAMANKPYKYIILGNEKELDMKSLEKIGSIKRVSTEEIFGF